MADNAGSRVPRRQEAFEEVRRFLDTWYFFISDCGFFFARPRRNRISLRDFKEFLNRLDLVCQGESPRMIIVEFTRLAAGDQFWIECQPLVHQFSLRTNSVARFERHGRRSAILIRRYGLGPAHHAASPTVLEAPDPVLQQAADDSQELRDPIDSIGIAAPKSGDVRLHAHQPLSRSEAVERLNAVGPGHSCLPRPADR